MTTSPRRPRLVLAAFLLVAVLALVMGAPPAGAGDGDGARTTTTMLVGEPDEGMIPRPNSGHEPTEAGDRGGALQLAVLGLIVVGVGIVGYKVFRQTQTGPKTPL